MKKKEWVIAAACVLIVLFGSEVYAQTATANSNQGQNQSQSLTGATGQAEAYANQLQGQSQYTGGSSAGVSNSGNSAIGINNSFNGAKPIRYLPVPSSVVFENYQPGLFGGPNYQDNGPDFISMRQLVAAMNLAKLDSPVLGEKSIRILIQPLGPGSKEKVDSVKFEINDGEAINHGFTPVAVFTVETEKPDKSNSASLALAIGKKAKELGASRVIFTTEGSSKELSSWGVGIGLSYNYASVGSDASDNGSVGAGGTGWSMGKAGYNNLIYLSAVAGN